MGKVARGSIVLGVDHKHAFHFQIGRAMWAIFENGIQARRVTTGHEITRSPVISSPVSCREGLTERDARGFCLSGSGHLSI